MAMVPAQPTLLICCYVPGPLQEFAITESLMHVFPPLFCEIMKPCNGVVMIQCRAFDTKHTYVSSFLGSLFARTATVIPIPVFTLSHQEMESISLSTWNLFCDSFAQ